MLLLPYCTVHREEWKAAVEAAAAAASRQVEELRQKMAAEAAAVPGHDKALLQQAQDAAAALTKQQVCPANQGLADLAGCQPDAVIDATQLAGRLQGMLEVAGGLGPSQTAISVQYTGL